ncbi:MAG: signal peptidase II [Gemmatimonadales bacterium]
MRSGARPPALFWAVALAILIADLVTKRLVELHLLPMPPVTILGDWVQLRLVYNEGAAFGLDLGSYSRWIFMALAAVAVVLLYRLSANSARFDTLRQLACGLVTGGAAGNLIDRIRHAHGVVDFIDVGIGLHRWPTFNVADMGVSVGAILLAISLWLEDSRRRAATASAS